MRFYEAAAEIHSNPGRIWKLLTDAPGFPAWNPTVNRVEGDIAPGHTIRVFVKVNPGRAFPVKITEFEPGRRMVWSGGMPSVSSKAYALTTSIPRELASSASRCGRSTQDPCSR